MSDKTNTLADIAGKIKAGLSRVNQDAKDKASGEKPTANVAGQHEVNTDLDDEPPEPGPANRKSEHLTATDHDDLEEGFIIEGEAEPTKPKAKGLTKPQKLLLIFALAVGAWYWTTTQPAPVMPGTIPETSELGIKNSDGDDGASIPSPSFDLPAEKPEDQPADLAIASSNNSSEPLDFGGATKIDDANTPLGNESLTADLNDQFGAMGDDTGETIDPFSGEVKPAQPLQSAQQAALTQKKEEAIAKAAAAIPTHSDSLGLLESPNDSPFSGGASKGNELSGVNSQNKDSKAGELLDQGANADVAKLKANLAEKDGRIGKLETELGKVRNDLAKANDDLAKAKAGKGHTSKAKPAQQKPAQTAKTTQRSPSTQRVANAPKAVARPQVCVTAVAQAARNCTTCVPHAFISHKGVETMVGQGDFLEGLRVNIVGDRLDLQNANGDVVHKFWSSQNGCAG
ncbi:hypothetical protein ACI77O_12015 [Pseudomonas tritici]|uniref:hypothetical protein n=1 Tax=Pseudomonas tritici TaxID=2745518 RepID=UPI00387B33F3